MDVCAYVMCMSVHGGRSLYHAEILGNTLQHSASLSNTSPPHHRHCCRYIDIITHSWDVHILERLAACAYVHTVYTRMCVCTSAKTINRLINPFSFQI